MELIELADHPFFTACQYHPEFLSRPGRAHPLFRGLIEAAQRQPQGHQKSGHPELVTTVRED